MQSAHMMQIWSP